MESVQEAFMSPNTTAAAVAPVVHHILSGSFRSLSLFLLAFSPLHRTLSLVQKIDAFGPHQYLATNPRKDRAYTTSWALAPMLSSWEIERPESAPWRVTHINNVPITATSSYITIPPPFTHAYSAGGPTGEVHIIDSNTGGFGEKLQQILFVPEDELEKADKTRVALRYGSHGVEFSPATGQAFIPVLGTDSIEMYQRDPVTGLLTHISSVPSPRGPGAHDGPRHLKVHPNGKILYCVTEHTNLVDAYTITPTSLTYLTSRSLLPPTTDRTHIPRFRGDTLLLAPPTPSHPAPRALFATTRGAKRADKGWLSVFALTSDGTFADGPGEHFETPTSGGKANALDLLAKGYADGDGVWILLTDDDDAAAGEAGGGVRVLEWDGWGKGVRVVAAWPVPGENAREETRMEGGSHAIWLD
ncbi:putative lactonase, 7-bladed beta-propeller [Lyophyllum shimeji]|uniref:Lactonase, 7-bladed beta-propeller n=1 Tax=Lyophyllum shimeji TaxID=47721 RepID=A0A9P3PSL2_LYOSH|nr:putative lactonase, 7-bladed beta-propeller [Lyophyllum shimeji]